MLKTNKNKFYNNLNISSQEKDKIIFSLMKSLSILEK